MSGANHCVAQVSLGLGASQERISNNAQRCGVAKVLGLCALAAGGEFVGVVDDLLGGAWHWNHLRYFGRAGMAWTMVGPSALSITPTLEEVAGGVGADEHHEAVIEIIDEHRMVERVKHVVVVDAVLAGAGCDQRRIHRDKLACHRSDRKLPCVRSGTMPSDQWRRATDTPHIPVHIGERTGAVPGWVPAARRGVIMRCPTNGRTSYISPDMWVWMRR